MAKRKVVDALWGVHMYRCYMPKLKLQIHGQVCYGDCNHFVMNSFIIEWKLNRNTEKAGQVTQKSIGAFHFVTMISFCVVSSRNCTSNFVTSIIKESGPHLHKWLGYHMLEGRVGGIMPEACGQVIHWSPGQMRAWFLYHITVRAFDTGSVSCLIPYWLNTSYNYTW